LEEKFNNLTTIGAHSEDWGPWPAAGVQT